MHEGRGGGKGVIQLYNVRKFSGLGAMAFLTQLMTVLSSEIRNLGYSMNQKINSYITFTGNRGRKNYKIKLHDTRQLERQLIFVIRFARETPLAAELEVQCYAGIIKRLIHNWNIVKGQPELHRIDGGIVVDDI